MHADVNPVSGLRGHCTVTYINEVRRMLTSTLFCSRQDSALVRSPTVKLTARCEMPGHRHVLLTDRSLVFFLHF